LGKEKPAVRVRVSSTPWTRGGKALFEDVAKVRAVGTKARDVCLKRLPARSRHVFFERVSRKEEALRPCLVEPVPLRVVGLVKVW